MSSPLTAFASGLLAQLILAVVVFGVGEPTVGWLLPASVLGSAGAVAQVWLGWRLGPDHQWPAVTAAGFLLLGWATWLGESLSASGREPLANFFGLLVFAGLVAGGVVVGLSRVNFHGDQLHSFRFALAQLLLTLGLGVIPQGWGGLVWGVIHLGVAVSAAQLLVAHRNQGSIARTLALAGGYLAITGYGSWLLASTFLPFAVTATLVAAAFEKMER